MTGPVRIQLRRTKGWRLPENTATLSGIHHLAEAHAIFRPRSATSIFSRLQSEKARRGSRLAETNKIAARPMGERPLRFGAVSYLRKANHQRTGHLRGTQACRSPFSAAQVQQQVPPRTAGSRSGRWDCQALWLTRSQEASNKGRLPEAAACDPRANGQRLRGLRPFGSPGASGAPSVWRWLARARRQRLALSFGHGKNVGQRFEACLSAAVRQLPSGRTL